MNRSRARSKEAIEFAREQRATANEFARTVWQWIRNRQVCDQKFRREYPIPPYTADFCCVELKLILEIDGSDHLTDEGRRRDGVRDDFLSRQGYHVVRIHGYDVLREPGKCRERIVEQVEKRMREINDYSRELETRGAQDGQARPDAAVVPESVSPRPAAGRGAGGEELR